MSERNGRDDRVRGDVTPCGAAAPAQRRDATASLGRASDVADAEISAASSRPTRHDDERVAQERGPVFVAAERPLVRRSGS